MSQSLFPVFNQFCAEKKKTSYRWACSLVHRKPLGLHWQIVLDRPGDPKLISAIKPLQYILEMVKPTNFYVMHFVKPIWPKKLVTHIDTLIQQVWQSCFRIHPEVQTHQRKGIRAISNSGTARATGSCLEAFFIP